MLFNDFREYIAEVERLGEYKLVKGADWEIEIGGMTEYLAGTPASPLVMFDEIKGYPKGYRVASNLFTTLKRTALALGLPIEAKGLDLVKACREREKDGVKPLPPVEIAGGPVKENIHTGSEVELFEFPAPKWHEHDGGRYLGTGSMTVIRDPDAGWVNLAPQRVQIHNRDTATIFMGPGRHNTLIRQKYWERGQPAPIAVCCGQEPLLWSVATRHPAWGLSEYDFTGGLRGKPVEVVRAPFTGLPIPATAEIVIEGELHPPGKDMIIEGPFGEWLGYYASDPTPEPPFKIKTILHRNDPIIQGNPPSVLPPYWTLGQHILKAAILWNELERNLPGVKGVWMLDDGSTQCLPVISIKQQYEGHARQAAMVVAGNTEFALLAGAKYIIVVDDDIDPTNVQEVLWAMTTRSDPERSITIIPGFRSSRTDPYISPDATRRGEMNHSVAVILACRPYHWIKDFPKSVRSSPELLQRMKERLEGMVPESTGL